MRSRRKPLSRIKKISGQNLARNWVMIPHVTQFDEADITELEALRVQLNKEHEKAGVKFTMLAFLIKASVAGLKKFPDFNSSLDGDNLVYKQYYNIGFAADTPNGLVVPVVKGADQKGLVAIAKEMAELSAKAREGKLGPADMQGGCFSISSLGGIGGTAFTPIVNAPEVAILGVSKGRDEAGVGRQGVRPEADAPVVAVLRPSRHRWRAGGTFHRVSDAGPRRFPARDPVRGRAMATIEVKVPDIGDFTDVPVIEVLVKPGDAIKAEDSLVTLESDKATMDVPSPAAGTVKAVSVKVGDKVSQGTLVLTLESAAEAAPSPQPSAPLPERERERAAPTAAAPTAEASPPLSPKGRAGPGVRAAPRPREPTKATSTSNAKCWCWAPGPAATAPRSAPPISA